MTRARHATKKPDEMLRIKKFTVNPVEENTYVASDDTREAAIIDCGCFTAAEWARVKGYIEAEGLRPVLLLNTHLHFDHCLGNRFATHDYNLLCRAARADHGLYGRIAAQAAMFLGDLFARQLDTRFTALLGAPLLDGETLRLGSHELRVVSTPGHSPGGVCFYCEAERTLFSGDSLFRGSIGRTDLTGGNYRDLVASLTERVLCLPDDTRVLPGHGPETDIGYERSFNPYL